MYIILGATGHIGSILIQQLVEDKVPVTGITSDPQKIKLLEKQGAQPAVADVMDASRLTSISNEGKKLYLLNPPAPASTDISLEEERRVHSILEAVKNSRLETIVAQSTYGAQEGEQIADLGVLYKMERQLKAIHPGVSIIRAAYFMSNWDASLESARQEGKIYSFFPPDFTLPMVAPADIARLAKEVLMHPEAYDKLVHIEGPRHYSVRDVAYAFETALKKPVDVAVIERDQWINSLRETGFSEKAAQSMANMTALTLDTKYRFDGQPRKGSTSMDQYIHELVTTSHNIKVSVQ